jgi:hypothetical protein
MTWTLAACDGVATANTTQAKISQRMRPAGLVIIA